MIREFFTGLKEETVYLNYGREIIANWCSEYSRNIDHEGVKILDIGCAQGADLLNIKNSMKDRRLELFGVEYHNVAETHEVNVNQAGQKGINVFQTNIESESIPVEDEFFDIVIANQVIEHTKEIFWIFSEISRVLRKDGIVIIGVPNLAALHSRILLLLGKQPSSIEILGPHVRGLTAPSFKRFIEADDYFKVLKIRGSNFYPFPPFISKFLSRLFPTFSVGLFFLIRRQNKKGEFIQVLDTTGAVGSGTPFFRGDRR